MKLTTSYIKHTVKHNDKIESIEMLEDNQIAVWLNDGWTWSVGDGNRTVNHYEIEGSHYQDDVDTFLNDLKWIEKIQ